MTDWVRLWHDMPTDPKWRVVARKSKQPLACVLAVFTLMLTNASGNAADRGVLLGWDHEDAGAALDMEAEDVAAIYGAMQGKVLDGDRLTGWERRQVECAQGSVGRGAKSYLYVIANSGSREVKIGTSRNPWARAKDLQTGTTGKTTVVATYPGIRSDETDVHALLAKHRKGGEWFDLPSEIYNFLMAKHDEKADAKHLVGELRSLLQVNYRSYEDKETEKYTETDSENKKVPADAVPLAFDGKIIRLTSRDLGRWKKAYPDIDVEAQLQSRDDWLSTEADAQTRKKWFVSTSNQLASLQQRAAQGIRSMADGPLC